VADLEDLDLALPDGLAVVGFLHGDRFEPRCIETVKVADGVEQSGEAGGGHGLTMVGMKVAFAIGGLCVGLFLGLLVGRSQERAKAKEAASRTASGSAKELAWVQSVAVDACEVFGVYHRDARRRIAAADPDAPPQAEEATDLMQRCYELRRSLGMY